MKHGISFNIFFYRISVVTRFTAFQSHISEINGCIQFMQDWIKSFISKHVAVKRNWFIIWSSKNGKRGTSENQRYFAVFGYKKRAAKMPYKIHCAYLLYIYLFHKTCYTARNMLKKEFSLIRFFPYRDSHKRFEFLSIPGKKWIREKPVFWCILLKFLDYSQFSFLSSLEMNLTNFFLIMF